MSASLSFGAAVMVLYLVCRVADRGGRGSIFLACMPVLFVHGESAAPILLVLVVVVGTLINVIEGTSTSKGGGK